MLSLGPLSVKYASDSTVGPIPVVENPVTGSLDSTVTLSGCTDTSDSIELIVGTITFRSDTRYIDSITDIVVNISVL